MKTYLTKLAYQLISLKVWIATISVILLWNGLITSTILLYIFILVLLGREGIRVIELLKGK
jgi:hypothetical protein